MTAQSLEDEMSRFEREIAGANVVASSAPQSFVIGASTFNAVQHQLSALRAQVYGPGVTSNDSNIPVNVSHNSMQPHLMARNGNMGPMMTNANLSHPGPGPGAGFLPPQLRVRPPMMSISAGQLQPPPHLPGNMALADATLNGGPMKYNNSERPADAVVEAPKIVYSAKPVLNKTIKKPAVPELKPIEPEPYVSRKREAPTVDYVQNSTAAPSVPAPSVEPIATSSYVESQPSAKKGKKAKERKFIRTAANDVWEDTSLAEWDPNDFRVFCGDLGNEVTDEKLTEAFKKYPSLQKAKVIRDRRTHKTKGYGFISFSDPADYTRAMREMNGKYVGNRPIKLRKSNWRDRNVEVVKKKEKEKKRLGFR